MGTKGGEVKGKMRGGREREEGRREWSEKEGMG